MPCSALAAFWASATTTIRSLGPPSAMTPALGGTAPSSPSSSSKVRRSIRARVGTGKITSVAATSLLITTRRGSNTDRSWVGRLLTGHRPCLCYEGGSRSFRKLLPFLLPRLPPRQTPFTCTTLSSDPGGRLLG